MILIRNVAVALAAPVACTIIVSCSAEQPPSKSAPRQESSATTAPGTKDKSESPERKASSSPAAKGYASPDAYITIVVRDGKVFLGKSVFEEKQGDQVIVKVMSDRADEFHLHGYDLGKELEPGKPVTLSFKAVIPGQFEAELHHLHLRLFSLRVR